jgi:hypothetical protein
MGFLDKARKMAEQAHAKVDEVQGRFNDAQRRRGPQGGPRVEYDQHGRPIREERPVREERPEAAASARNGDPL